MKQVSVLFIVIISVTIVAFPQSRVLVIPNDEVIPLKKGEGAVLEIAKRNGLQTPTTSTCSNTVIDGFTQYAFPTNSNFSASHKDVLGQWFVAQFSGSIDTLYWYNLSRIDAIDSVVWIRIFKSKITPSSGPGVRPGPYNPPCQPWGYYLNTNDFDQGISPFKDEATDTNWISTYPGDTVSFDPLGEEIWGMGGFPTFMHTNQINFLPLNVLPNKLLVKKGDVFFITMRMASALWSFNDRTEFAASGFSSINPGYQEYYPSRLWKFYEHDSGPLSCGSVPSSQLPKGWYARGGFNYDTLDVAVYNWWYSMTITENRPPQIMPFIFPEYTYDTSEKCTAMIIYDCDSAGNELQIAEAEISYSVNGIFGGIIPMTLIDSQFWSGCIPGQNCWNTVNWSIQARDIEGVEVIKPFPGFTVICLENDYTVVDTSSNCTPMNIASSGNLISSESFFNAPNNPNWNPKDDGTAGPFPLGGTFNFYGQELRYAWVGVNGAIALSETATETLDVNSNGFYTRNWHFPGAIRSDSDTRDTAGLGKMPPNFIAPFGGDLIYGDVRFGSQFGTIRWDTIGCKFIVQWDSIMSNDAYENTHLLEFISFRVILDRCNGMIEFQYDNVGWSGLDTTALIGFQADTIHSMNDRSPWSFVNESGFPIESRVQNGSCYRISQMYSITLNDKWNIVPIFVDTTDTIHSVSHLFPNATSLAFKFSSHGYERTETVEPGECYWIKFNGQTTYNFPISYLDTSSVEVEDGWNLVHTKLPCVIPSPNLPQIQSGWYGYDNGYRVSSTLLPYCCYWVKSFGGRITFDCGLSLAQPKNETFTSLFNTLNKLTITDNSDGEQTLYIGSESDLKTSTDVFELPPLPPSGLFDVRFSTNKMVETFSNKKKNEEFTINVQSLSYPLTLTWDVANIQIKTLILSDNNDENILRNVQLRGKGSVKITNPSVTQLRLRTIEGIQKPLEFALYQNYPNPFNPSTNFGFRIVNRELVTLKVFDVLGREVETLANEVKEPGEFSVQWETSNVPSGVYFYKLTAGRFVNVKKSVLIR